MKLKNVFELAILFEITNIFEPLETLLKKPEKILKNFFHMTRL